MNGENRTSLAILSIAVLSLILGGVFAPRIGVEAKSGAQQEYMLEDVSSWLLRLAAWLPAETPPEHPGCRPAAGQAMAPWGIL